MKVCSHTNPPLYRGQTKRIAEKYRRQYESLKGAIYQHLSKRHEFQKAVDSALIELAARLYADWLYIEEVLGTEEGKAAVWKYADALAKIHGMLIATLDELHVTPKMRGKIAQEIVEDNQITAKLKSLMGVK
jgi:hypothetical protein